jgi:hypothetical protein
VVNAPLAIGFLIGDANLKLMAQQRRGTRFERDAAVLKDT